MELDTLSPEMRKLAEIEAARLTMIGHPTTPEDVLLGSIMSNTIGAVLAAEPKLSTPATRKLTDGKTGGGHCIVLAQMSRKLELAGSNEERAALIAGAFTSVVARQAKAEGLSPRRRKEKPRTWRGFLVVLRRAHSNPAHELSAMPHTARSTLTRELGCFLALRAWSRAT